MSIDRDEMLERLKMFPDERLAELIFRLKLQADIPEYAAPSRRAMKLIQHAEAMGDVVWRQLVSLVEAKSTSPETKENAGSAHVDISRIVKYAPETLIGRETETKLLEDSWQRVTTHEPGRPHVLGFVALGGEGKTSLVAKWLAGMAGKDWPGCESVFAWSFYSQGSREQVAVSSDLFLAEALKFFGDPEMAGSAQGAYEKGQRLAELVGGQRSLLILDGVEPLQYPPSSPTGSRLKDQGVEALLKGLAASSNGLCIVTTRYSIPDLAAFAGSTWHEEELKRLSREAGVALLKDCGVKGSERPGSGNSFYPKPQATASGDSEDAHASGSRLNEESDPLNEYEQLVEDVQGHALTLQILGQYLKRAHHGDIRRRDRVELAKADSKVHASGGFGTGHAFRAIAAYEAWLADDSEESRRELAVLRVLGLFDRPATADCVEALRQPPAIDGLTDPLVDLPDEDWEFTLTTLSDARLVSVNRDEATGELVSLDAHPLIREYFALQLRRPDQAQRRSGNDETDDHADAGASSLRSSIRPTKTSEVWRAAHRRLYEHLCETTHEGDQPTLEDLQPLYQAVAHGCHAGLQQRAFDDVYWNRITRGGDYYSFRKLGAFGSDLGAVACLFDQPWSVPSGKVSESDQAVLLSQVSFYLRAMGRGFEALEPMRAGFENYIEQENWHYAAITASNLSELELTLGEVSGALSNAERSVTYADRSGDADERMINRTTHADALHQSGHRSEAESLFREAEQMQAERQPAYPLLYSVQGFQYCDLLLAPAEREAWRRRLTPRVELSGPLLDSESPATEVVAERPLAAEPLLPNPADERTPESGDAASESGQAANQSDASPSHSKACRAVTDRATQTLKWMVDNNMGLLDIALDHLTLSRAALYESLLVGPVPTGSSEPAADAVSDAGRWEPALREIEAAVSGLRRAGTTHHLPRALLTRAWQRSLLGRKTGPDSAQSDLDEAWEIASRGPMPLFMADIHLHRARLFGSLTQPLPHRGEEQVEYPWESVEHDLAEARRLIEKHGYGRRTEELEDAEEALLGKRG